jgi:hypothetical protein
VSKLQVSAGLAFIAAVYGIVGDFDFADALISEAQKKEELPAIAARTPLLAHPLPYAMTLRDCLPSGRECSRTRYYIPTSAR